MIEFEVGNLKVGDDCEPIIIAEMSGNHNQSIDRALQIVKEAHLAGAHAIKLQTYTADTITINQHGGLFDITDKDSLWYGKNLYELYNEAHTPWEWHEKIFDYAKKLGIVAFSSPFDESAVDFLEGFNVPAYKISSFENNHFPLLKKVAKTGKPIFLSTGASNLNEVCDAVNYLKINGASDIVIFKCTSNYPAPSRFSNLNTIPVLKSIFNDCVLGLSDHTKGIGVSIASIALGARVIEKHFTLNRNDGGVDSAFSLEPLELNLLVRESKRAFLSLGDIQLDSQKSEERVNNLKGQFM